MDVLQREGVITGRDGLVLWSDASDSPVALPDSRERWEAISRLMGQEPRAPDDANVLRSSSAWFTRGGLSLPRADDAPV